MPVFAPPLGFSVQGAGGDSGGVNPSSNTTYYVGNLFGVDFGTTDAPPAPGIEVPCTLRAVNGEILVVGTKGSNENSQLMVRKRTSAGATSDVVTLTTTQRTDDAGGRNRFDFTGLSASFAQGDSVFLKWVTPAWATAPTLVFVGWTAYFEN